jgi:hypothetical protein
METIANNLDPAVRGAPKTDSQHPTLHFPSCLPSIVVRTPTFPV